MTDELRKQISEFRKKTELFAKGELSVKDYKGYSGRFGSYAQRGAKNSMLRLRMSGGRISKQHLKAIIDICDKYDIKKAHCTTCQTIQLHDIALDKVADVLTDAIESGFYTMGGGGDFPRNVMVSPLSGVEKGENFDVFPYANAAAAYLTSTMDEIKMPRKLKVAFSNSSANAVHATFRDLGFVSRADGLFDVYCAGGMGMNPKMGVKVADGIDGKNVVYYVKAMRSFFCKYGNYENRARARTRYIQDVLGDEFKAKFQAELDAAFASEDLTFEPKFEEITKVGKAGTVEHVRAIPQKQDGLYAVKFHPIGGQLSPDDFKTIYTAIENINDASIRVAPDETLYIINCDANEAKSVIDATANGAAAAVEESVACIGAEICQQGLRDSQELLREILAEVRKHDFAPDALPIMHISGCMSSCGTHQIGKIGFHGKVKMIDKKPVPGFSVSINGNDTQCKEHFGEDVGVMATDEIPQFVAELGEAVTASGLSYDEFAKSRFDELMSIVKKYA